MVAAVEQAAAWLAAAGYEIEEVEPPHFAEGAQLWRQLVMDDMRRGAAPAVESTGDAGVRSALQGYMAGLSPLDRDQTLEALTRRFNICRDWAVFFDRYPVLLMPNSWQRQFPIDADIGSPEQVHGLLAAQSPLLGTAMMGLPTDCAPARASRCPRRSGTAAASCWASEAPDTDRRRPPSPGKC